MAHILLQGLSIYTPPAVTMVEEYINWTALSSGLSADSQGNLMNNNGAEPSGAVASKKLGGNGSYLQFRLADGVYGSNAAQINISDDSTTYTYVLGSLSFRFNNGELYRGATKLTDALPDNSIARFTVSNGVDLIPSWSSNAGSTWTVLPTLTGVLTGLTNKYIKAIFTLPSGDRQIREAKVYGGIV